MKSEIFFHKVVENIPEVISVPILVSDEKGKILYANSSAQEVLQESLKHISKKNITELFSEIENFSKYITDAFSGKKIRIFDQAIRDRRGETMHLDYLEVASLSIPGEADRFVVLSFRKKEEGFVEKFIGKEDSHIDNYEVVWRGISHEVKNPLGGIKGAAQILLKNLEENSPYQDHARIILREAERINRFLDNLSSSGASYGAGNVDILTLLTEAIALIKSQISSTGKEITIKLIADTSLPGFYGHSDDLFRVFMNLLKNSVEAIEGKGSIRITLKMHEDLVFSEKDKTRNYIIEMEFYDTGKLIKEDEIPFIFLPFYTSKPGGTGMGLFFAKNMVKAQGGSIRVKLFPEGKAFRVYLPLKKEAIQFGPAEDIDR